MFRILSLPLQAEDKTSINQSFIVIGNGAKNKRENVELKFVSGQEG